MAGPLVPTCTRCDATSPTPAVVCAKCNAVVYCSDAHRSEDATSHKKTCKTIVDARKLLATEERKLRRKKGDMFMPDDVFEECIGEFWLIDETRPFMRAKYALMDKLANVGTALAVEQALQEARECLALSEQDNLGVREVVPALQLMLGQVQEAYDFVHWWAGDHDNDESDNDSFVSDEYDGSEEDDDEKTLAWKRAHRARRIARENGEEDEDEDRPPRIVPCFRVTRSNVTEGLDLFEKPYNDSVFTRSALTYIKLTTAYGLNGAVQQLSNPNVDVASNESLRRFLHANNLPADVEQLKTLHETVLGQGKRCFEMTQTRNPHFWKRVADPKSLTMGPVICTFSHGSAEEVVQHLKLYATLWHMTPFAIDFVAKSLEA